MTDYYRNYGNYGNRVFFSARTHLEASLRDGLIKFNEQTHRQTHTHTDRQEFESLFMAGRSLWGPAIILKVLHRINAGLPKR